MGWLSGWAYRKSTTLSRASGAVSNYQMKLLVGESSGATGEAVDCGGHCLSSFNDLRFTKSDGTTLLDYWIESTSGSTPNQLATVWIEFDSIGTSDTTFYMCYGKSDADAASSGVNTFDFFDDFERGSSGDSPGNEWTATGSSCISTTHAYQGSRCCKLMGSASNYYGISRTVSGGPYAFRVRFWKDNAASFYIIYGEGSSKRMTTLVAGNEYIMYATSSNQDTGKNALADQWDIMEVRNYNFTSYTYDIYYTGDTLAKTGAGMQSIADDHNFSLLCGPNGIGNNSYVDCVIFRKFLPTEPAWGSWGAEEVGPSYLPLYMQHHYIPPFLGGN